MTPFLLLALCAALCLSTAKSYGLQVLLNGVTPAPTHRHHPYGASYVEGAIGRRYGIRVSNNLSRRVEVVVSVDGLDVIDGKSASTRKRGYVLAPFSSYVIPGFRLSRTNVAAFRFSSVKDSYRYLTSGESHSIGKISASFFPERRYISRPLIAADHDWSRARGRGARSSNLGPSFDFVGAAPAGRMESGSSATGVFRVSRPDWGRTGRLGTRFGESRRSIVKDTSFIRDSSAPATTLVIKYHAHSGPPRISHDPQPLLPDAHNNRRGFATPPAGWAA